MTSEQIVEWLDYLCKEQIIKKKRSDLTREELEHYNEFIVIMLCPLDEWRWGIEGIIESYDDYMSK